MYISASKAPFSSQNFFKRSNSLNKVGDQSSLFKPTAPENLNFVTGSKSNETLTGNFYSTSKKTVPIKASRPTTAQTQNHSSKKMSQAMSRSPSPFNLPSPNTTLQTSPAKKIDEKVPDATVYEAIKSQNKSFFNKGASELPYFIPMKEMPRRQKTLPDASVALSFRERLNTTNKCDRLMSEMSPRKRLAQMPMKVYNVKVPRLKDLLRDSMKVPPYKTMRSFITERKLSREKNKGIELIDEGRNLAQIAAAEKLLEEERRMIDNIGRVSKERFYENIELYNKFFTAYLEEPEVHYMTPEDLGVERKARIKQRIQSINQEIKRLNPKNKSAPLKKGMGTGKPGGSLAVKAVSGVNSERKTQGTKQGIVKIVVEKRGKDSTPTIKKNVEWADVMVNTEREESKTERFEMALFDKEVAKIESNLRNLEMMGNLMSGSGAMNEEEQNFLKAVKMGNEVEVRTMLRKNCDLVKIRDTGNQTPLHWAMKRNYLGIIGDLYSSGADLEALDMAGRKPLDLAHETQRREIINVLEQRHWTLRRKTIAFPT